MLKMLHLLLLHLCDQTALQACPCQSAHHMTTFQSLLHVMCINDVKRLHLLHETHYLLNFDTGNQE